MFTLSNSAQKQLETVILENNFRGAVVDLKKSGCSGYKYVLSYTSDIKPEWVEYSINDIIKIFVSKDNKNILTNTTIDYKTDLFKEGFEFTNPNEISQCGCGESVQFDNQTLRL